MAQAQRLITADYNGLSNKPIINAALPVLPNPPANTYFRHTGSTTGTFTNGVIYKWDGVEYKELGTGTQPQPIDLSKYIQADTLTGLLPNVQYALVHDSDNVFTLVEVEGGGTGTGWFIATSDAEVEALLIEDNIGKFFMFIGTSETYLNYSLYQIVVDDDIITPALVFFSAESVADALEDIRDDLGDLETAIEGKQDTLVSGTNIKTINNQSILGEGNIEIQGGGGGTSDYDDLENTPIINQHETHIVEFKGFEVGQVLHNGDKIHFDTTKGNELATYLAGLTYQDGAYPLIGIGLDYLLVAADWSVLSGGSVSGYAIIMPENTVFYSTVAYPGSDFGDIDAGFQNLDSNGDYTIPDNALTISEINDTTPATWNGVIIGLQEETVEVSPAPVDGKYYKRTDGDLYKFVEEVIPEHLGAFVHEQEVHKGWKIRFNKNLDIDTFLNGLEFPQETQFIQLYQLAFADGDRDNEIPLEQLAIMNAGAISDFPGGDAKGIIIVAGTDRILYATESGSIMGMDAATEEVITISYTQGWNTDLVDENGDYEPQFISIVYDENPHYSTFDDGILGVSNQLNQELWNGVLVGEVVPAEDKSVYDKVVLQSELKKEEGSTPTFKNEAEAIAFAKEENLGKVAQYVGENQLAQTTISYADRFTVVINKAAFINALDDQAGEVEFTFNGTDWLPDTSDYGITVSGDAIEGDKFVAIYHGDGTFHVDDVVTNIYYADGADFSKVFTYSAPQAFVSHNYMKSGDKFHFDTTADFDTFLAGLSYGHNMCTLVGGEDYFGIIAGSTTDTETGDPLYIVGVNKASFSFDIIYSTGTFEGNDGNTYTRGWYNLDANGDYRISLAEDNEISLPNDGAWNGTLIGLKIPTNATNKDFIGYFNVLDSLHISAFDEVAFGTAINHIDGTYDFRYDAQNQTIDLYKIDGYEELVASSVDLTNYGFTLDNPVYPQDDTTIINIEYAYKTGWLNILGFTGVDNDDDPISGNYVATIDGDLMFEYNSYDIGGTGHIKGIDGESMAMVKGGVVSPVASMIFVGLVDSLTITSVVAQSSWDDLMSKVELPNILTVSQLVSRLEVEVDTNKFAANSDAKVGKAFRLIHKDGEWQRSLPAQGTPISEADPYGGSVSIYGNTALDVDEVAAILDNAPFQSSGEGTGDSQVIFTYSTDQGNRGAYLYSFLGSWIIMIRDESLGEVPIAWSNSPMLTEYLGLPSGWVLPNFTIATTNGISVTEGYEDTLAQLLSLTPFEAGYEAVDIDALGISVEGEPEDGDKLDITLFDSAYKKSEFYRVDAKDEDLGANIGDEITTLYFDTNSTPVYSDFLNYENFPLNDCGVFYASNTYAQTGETDGLFYVSLYDLGVSGASEEDIAIGTHMRYESLVPSSIVYSSIACTVDINGEQASVSQGWSVDHYTYDPPFVAIGNEGYFAVYPVIMEENIKAIQKYVHIKPFDYIPEKIYYLYKFYLSPDESAGGGSVVVDLGNVVQEQSGQFSPSSEVFELLANGATTVKLSAGSIECYATLVEHGTFADFYNAEFYFFKGKFHEDPEHLLEDEEVYNLTVALSPDMDGVKFGYYTFTSGSGSGGVSMIGSMSGAIGVGDGLTADLDNNSIKNTGVLGIKNNNEGSLNDTTNYSGTIYVKEPFTVFSDMMTGRNTIGMLQYSPITLTYDTAYRAFKAYNSGFSTLSNGKLFALLFDGVAKNTGSSTPPRYWGVALMSSFTSSSEYYKSMVPVHILVDDGSSGTTYTEETLIMWFHADDAISALFHCKEDYFSDQVTIKVLRLL